MGVIKFRQGVIVVLALALITALYFMSQVADPGQHRAIIDHLREIRRMEVTANQDTLEARSGLLRHYDTFAENSMRISEVLREIRDIATLIYGSSSNDITRGLGAFVEQYDQRLQTLEDFKSDNAVLRNSLGYFPVAAAEISPKVRQEGAGALADSVDRLRLDVLEYYLNGGDTLRNDIVSRMQRLTEATRPGPRNDPAGHAFNQRASEVSQLLVHVDVILEYRDRVNAEVENVLAHSVRQPVENLLTITEQHYAKSLNETNIFRFLLYAAAITLLCFIAVMIVQIQRAALALHQAKEEADRANRTKTQFLANMSHELRTPLNAIVGFAKIMASEMFGPIGHSRYKDYASDIYASGNQLVALIGDILDISKVEAGKLEIVEEIVNVRDVVTDSTKLVSGRAAQANINLVVSVPDDLPLLRVDKIRVKQVILNLLDNSLKFTPPNGEVGVEGCLDEHGGISIKVTDTGIGIARHDMKKVLQAFGQADHSYTHTYRGAGLGLALSKSLMELHGGGLEIASELGRGTVVTARFPAERTIANN